MQVFIMRHGQASFEAQSDAARPLTPQGELEAQMMGKWLSKMGHAPELIWVSPYMRAQQTFEQVGQHFTQKHQVKTMAMVTPSGSAKDVHDLLDGELALNHIEQLLIVSHMPFVSYLVAELTQQQKAPIFQTAGICEIAYDTEKHMGEFIRMVAPIDLC